MDVGAKQDDPPYRITGLPLRFGFGQAVVVVRFYLPRPFCASSARCARATVYGAVLATGSPSQLAASLGAALTRKPF